MKDENVTCSQNVNIIGEGKELFREGILQRGNEDDFEYEVLDYAECRMPDDVTVSEVYQNTKLGRTTL